MTDVFRRSQTLQFAGPNRFDTHIHKYPGRSTLQCHTHLIQQQQHTYIFHTLFTTIHTLSILKSINHYLSYACFPTEKHTHITQILCNL